MEVLRTILKRMPDQTLAEVFRGKCVPRFAIYSGFFFITNPHDAGNLGVT